MEAEERPLKIQKLSHDYTKATERQVQSNDSTTTTANTDLTPSIIEQDSSNVDIAREAKNLAETTSSKPLLSKNQLKKLRKKQEWEAGREYRKAKRRDKTKERKARKRAEKQDIQGTAQPSSKPHANGQRCVGPRVRLPITFVIDCGFDDLMMEKERISLGSQLTRAYSDNTRARFQAHLYVSSWGGELRNRFDGLMEGMYKNWKGVVFIEDDFVEAAKIAGSQMHSNVHRNLTGAFQKYVENNSGDVDHDVANGSDETHENGGTADVLDTQLLNDVGTESSASVDKKTVKPSADINGTTETPRESHGAVSTTNQDHNAELSESTEASTYGNRIIYLTSDSPNTLTELKPDHVYIIGGLVDKNRHKGICYKTACDRGIETAKLPIREYMQMTGRSVLATNHVFEIMLKWLESGDWGQAFLQVMPKRKGGVLKTTITGNVMNDPGKDVEAEENGSSDNPNSELEDHPEAHYDLAQESESTDE